MCENFYKGVMGQPTILRDAGTIATSGDNEVVAAPAAGYCYALLYLQVQNESTTATTVLIKHGSTTVGRVLCQNQGDGLIRDFTERPMLLPEATALNINLSGANSHGYTIEIVLLKVG